MLSIKNCGLMLEPQEGMGVDEIVSWAQYAENSGYGYIFRSDHILPTDGNLKLSAPECWTSLGAVAAKTRKIKFGTMVSPIGFRNPALLARMACTLHSYSKGRLLLGVGAGWYEDEYLAHGMQFPDDSTRVAQFEEALKIIRPLTKGERVDFVGRYFSAKVECHPKPYGGKIHLIVGAFGKKTVKLALEYSDEWNIFSHPLEKYRTLREEEFGGAKIESTEMGPFFIFETKREADSFLEKRMKARNFSGDRESYLKRIKENSIAFGTIEEFKSSLGEKKDAGIDRFYFQLQDPKDKKMVRLLTRAIRSKKL